MSADTRGSYRRPRVLRAVFALAALMVVVVSAPPQLDGDARRGSGAVALVARPVPLAVPPARRPPETSYGIDFKTSGAFVSQACLRSDTTIRNNYPGPYCSGWKGITNKNWSMLVPYTAGDHVYADVKVRYGAAKNDIDVTDAKWCTFSGTVQAVKFQCDSFINATRSPPPPPTIAPFDPATAVGDRGKSAQLNLLNVLAWCVSAAGVAGLLIIGIQMALQTRRGVPGAMAELRQEVTIVAVACILSMAAGPLVQFVGLPGSLW
ncbi:hypothetical protein [Actinoplanes sp. NPDC051494]|uniref:hypothetical protein n=1 Tax=Actinoplanes sp. NPDC051494 TaxID=3363907 RepID=UPI00379E923D